MTNERKSALPRKQLDPASLARLEAILAKGVEALVDDELAFLWGRRDYLTADERKDYGVDGKTSPVAKKEAPEEPTDPEGDDDKAPEGDQDDNAPDGDDDGDDADQDEYDVMDKEALKAACKERGLKVSGTNEELRERLRG